MRRILFVVCCSLCCHDACLGDDTSVVARMNDIEENARLINGRFENQEHSITTLKEANKRLEERIAALEGQLKDLQNRKQDAEISEKSGKEVVSLAQNLMTSGKLDKAVDLLSEFLEKNKHDIYRGQAYYYLGVIYQKNKKYNDALAAYKTSYQENPNGSKAADALFGMGDCINKLKGCEAAMVVLTQLKSKFPQKKKLADELLAKIEKHNGKNRRKVQ